MNPDVRQDMAHGVHFAATINDWATPWPLFRRLDAEFAFDLDPCASSQNAKCARFFTVEQDGLVQPWQARAVFMNPPYGRSLGRWVAKAHDEVASGRASTVVALIPARTDTGYWHEHVMRAAEVRLVRRRLRFGDDTEAGPVTKAAAPFPSAVVIFRAHNQDRPVFSTMQAREDALS